MTYDSATGVLTGYTDGAPRVSTVISTAKGSLVDATTDPLFVGPGDQHLALGYGASGETTRLDEVKVSDIARTRAELHTAAGTIPLDDGMGPAPGHPAPPTGLDSGLALIPSNNVPTAAKIALGKAIFEDTALSNPAGLACRSCHDPALGFADGLPRAVGVGGAVGPRNTPAIVNRVYSREQFWDGRAEGLEAQALEPFTNPLEMAQPDLKVVIDAVDGDASYAPLLAAAGYPSASSWAIAESLASYVRSLEAGGSPVDDFHAGLGGLSASAEAGLLLFEGKARCAGCHFGPNLTSERLHVTVQDDPVPDPGDGGAYDATGRPRDLEAFKTPTLRNVDLTAPYFHDGSAATLEDVVDQYADGGRGDGRRDPEISPLDLSPAERAQLIDFLRSLTSPTDASTGGAAVQQAWP